MLLLLPPPLPPPPPAPVEPWYDTGVVDLTLAAKPLPPPPLAGPEETEAAAFGAGAVLCMVPCPESEEGERLWCDAAAAAAAAAAECECDEEGPCWMKRGLDVVVRRWCCDGSVLYAVDGSDSDCLEPFFRLPIM